jgi:D-serine deaminase-like pyridoxal phosphate-dependent protein
MLAAMQTTQELSTPALLLDLDVLEGNLRRMADRCTELGVRLRPHIKTHKCIEIALGQRELGAAGITVSTLHEARVFADAGFDDITWAFPLVLSRLPEAVELAHRIRLGVTVDSAVAVEALAATRAPFPVWLKVDCGYHRSGVSPDSDAAVEIPARIMEATELEFAGLLSHSGDAYAGVSPGHIARIAHGERDVLNRLSIRLEGSGIRVPDRSAGSTPSMAHVQDLSGVTEVRPGNYSLYDFTQVALSSCAVENCAATVLASVVSSRVDDRTSVVDAGALALSADPGPPGFATPTMGEILSDDLRGTVRQNARIVSLSQEHGVVSSALPVGTRVRVIPNHSCLSVACFDAFFVVRGDEVLDRWAIHRGR